MTQPLLYNLPAMTDAQQASFYSSYNASQKNEITGVLLAVFLGGFGAHHFYLRQTGLGVLYLLFGITGIPWIVALIEAFFMPGRVRRFNAELSAYLVATITGNTFAPGVSYLPQPPLHCSKCGTVTPAGVRFCGRCGGAMAS